MSLIMSIHKQYCDAILSGAKTIELRKSAPSNIEAPFKVYMYETLQKGGCGKLVGEFICSEIIKTDLFSIVNRYLDKTEDNLFRTEYAKKICLSLEDIYTYAGNHKFLYLYKIAKYRKYSKPISLSELGLRYAPISWQIYRKTNSEKKECNTVLW